MNKICNKCGLEKSIEDFSIKHGKCKSCRNDECKNNRLRTCHGCNERKISKEFIRSERYCVHCRDLRDSNKKESKRKCAIKYRREHPDKIKAKNAKAFKRKYYDDNPKRILTYRLQACKKRAKDKKLNYDLDIDFMMELFNTQIGTCAVTGIQFNFKFDELFSKRPFSPSIDRINSSTGYTKTNVRLVCSCVNTALNEYGDQIFDLVCESYIQKKRLK